MIKKTSIQLERNHSKTGIIKSAKRVVEDPFQLELEKSQKEKADLNDAEIEK